MWWDLLALLSESSPPAVRHSCPQSPNLHDHLETNSGVFRSVTVGGSCNSWQGGRTGWNAVDLHQRGAAAVADGGQPGDGVLEDLLLIRLHQVQHISSSICIHWPARHTPGSWCQDSPAAPGSSPEEITRDSFRLQVAGRQLLYDSYAKRSSIHQLPKLKSKIPKLAPHPKAKQIKMNKNKTSTHNQEEFSAVLQSPKQKLSTIACVSLWIWLNKKKEKRKSVWLWWAQCLILTRSHFLKQNRNRKLRNQYWGVIVQSLF